MRFLVCNKICKALFHIRLFANKNVINPLAALIITLI